MDDIIFTCSVCNNTREVEFEGSFIECPVCEEYL